MASNTEQIDHDCLDDISDENLWKLLDQIVDNNNDDELLSNNICIICKASNLVVDTNKSVYTCQECGAENGAVFDQRPEWTSYEEGTQENGRCGVATNPFLPKSSMCTVIGGKGFSKLKMIQNWNQMPYKERSLSDVLQNIERNLKTYKITKAIIDNAKILYKNISEIKHNDGINKGKTIIIRGLNRSGLIAACAYYGSKLQGMPRSTKEIADIFGLKLTQVTKGCRKFLELINYQSLTYNLHSSHSYDFIERFGYKLKLKKNHIDIAIKIAQNINKLDIASDHQPTSVASGSILLTSHIYELNVLKKDISDIFGISEVTIIKTYKKIYPYKKILINNDLTDLLLKKINQKMNNSMQPTKNINITDNNIDIKSNLNKIFMMPDDFDSEALLSGQTTLSSILSNSETVNINSNKVSIDIEKIIELPKKKRGRPRNEDKKLKTQVKEIGEKEVGKGEKN
jgi:transcription initiation factor TFIIIB Brf1 subunit/transcription initiation factor TFIIB